LCTLHKVEKFGVLVWRYCGDEREDCCEINDKRKVLKVQVHARKQNVRKNKKNVKDFLYNFKKILFD